MSEPVAEALTTRSWPAWLAPAGAFVAYAVLTVVFTWPLWSDPVHLGIPNPDFYGNTWVMAWDVHQLLRDPLHLYDSNLFFPLEKSLVYNESLLPQSLLASPILLLGASPVLAHNFAFLLTFALSGWSAFRLAREMGASGGGAFLAGLGFALCPFRFKWMNNIQCGSIQWLPLAILYLLRSARGGRPRHLILLFLTALLQALSSGYFALLEAAALGVVGLWLLPERLPRRRLLHAGLALGLAAAVAYAIFSPYFEVQRREGLVRTRAEWVNWSANPGSYLDPGPYAGLPHLKRLHGRFAGLDPYYPGGVFLLLGGVGLIRLWRTRAARLALLLTALGMLLSFGPEIHLGKLALPGVFGLLRLLPGVSSLRAPSRFGVLAVLGITLLASLAWTALIAKQRHANALTAGLVLLALVEAFPSDLAPAFRPLEPPPAAMSWLARAPRGPVLELPWGNWDEAGLYAYWSTVHWQPLLDGWGSFQPVRAAWGLGRLGGRFPSDYASRVFRQNGVAYVVVHLDRIHEGHRARLLDATTLPDGVALAADFGTERIYTLAPWEGPPPRDRAE